jgi:hypothetical protein
LSIEHCTFHNWIYRLIHLPEKTGFLSIEIK